MEESLDGDEKPTCLKCKVTPYCLLPDSICGECTENVNNFYTFIKNCLQNIIILEAQYDIQESCLKSKQKKDKSCYVDIKEKKVNKGNQTDDYLDVLSGRNLDFDYFPLTMNFLENQDQFVKRTDAGLVEYDIDSDSSQEEHSQNQGEVLLSEQLQSKFRISHLINVFTNGNVFPTKSQYFDDSEKNLISEISQRKNLKRKNEFIESSKPKIYKVDTSNRRKNKVPKKLDTQDLNEEAVDSDGEKSLKIGHIEAQNKNAVNGETESLQNLNNQNETLLLSLPQSCLLCDTDFSGPSTLAAHVFEAHGIDMAEIVSSGSGESFPEKNKKKLPNLVKISDLKKTDSIDDNHSSDRQLEDQQGIACPNCFVLFTSKQDLMMHLKLKHAQLAGFVCGICLYQCSSLVNLKSHLEVCSQQKQVVSKYVCQVCQYGDDNFKWLENHVLVHEFLQEACKRQMKMFDPEDYIDINENTCYKGLSCTECNIDEFFSFKEFSAHRRTKHNIFHCDLCNKFYGRNSHLWKHVNRLHKGHPSITCQLCYKTSASKYHLSQHFNKIHLAKSSKSSCVPDVIEKDNSRNKFSAFDFLSIRDSFLKQEVENSEQDDNSNQHSDQGLVIKEEYDEDFTIKEDPSAPKEIDSSHDMYNNIITNYTPPSNEGDFKCPKCSKGFNKKVLLKKHKKNCRPRMQKDLLTRCKTCSRIFKDRQSLAKHLVNYHSEYTCEICLEKVQSKCEIVSHIRFRHPGCPLFCRICKNILRCKSDMQEHLRNHFDSHVCQFCGDSLPSKIKLKMHILSLHRKILSLSCGICLKLFETQHVLRDHVKLVHKDQLAPYTCPICGKNYGSRWKTYDHINKSHGRIFRACKTCLEVFDNDAQLQAHCDVTAHGGQLGNTNATATALRNSIMAHIKSALIVKNEEDSITDDEANTDSEFDNEPEPYEEDRKFYFPSQDDAKISLLEKRLLGKALTDDENTIKLEASAGKKKKSSKTKQLVTVKKEDPDHPPTNSSKRTVYVNSNDPSYCEICYKTWPAKKHLWQHYIRCHKSIAATVCGICLKTNDNYETLQKHLRDNHPKLLHGQGFGSNFICKICGRYHNASSKLRLHMVIHENFDWKLIEDSDRNSLTSKPSTNGHKIIKEEPQYEDNINYDSLIEQIECSSQSYNEESDNEPLLPMKREDSSSDEGEGSDEESVQSWAQIEKKSQIPSSQEPPQQRQGYSSSSETSTSSYCQSNCSSSEEECSQESKSVSSHSQNKFASKSELFNPRSNSETVDDGLNTNNSNIFDKKPEELDSAIKSISYDECIEQVDLDVVDNYCELQNNCLNETEIESAVGSIL